MRESGYYPPGAEFDPRAPWNESEDDSQFSLEFDGDLSIKRRYNFWAEDEWDEETGSIHMEDFESFVAKKLDLNIEEKWENEEEIEIQEIEDLPNERFKFTTNWGSFETDIDELVDMTNLF